jgi:hypothetical protein
MLPAASPFTSSGGGGIPSPRAEGAGQSTGSASPQLTSPRHAASPPCGVDGRHQWAGTTVMCTSSHHPASPSIGVDGRRDRGSKDQQQQHHLSLHNTTSRYLPTPRSPARFLLGPALSKMGRACAHRVPYRLRFHQAMPLSPETILSLSTSNVLTAGSKPVSLSATPQADKKLL